jgi:hypothetical protein
MRPLACGEAAAMEAMGRWAAGVRSAQTGGAQDAPHAGDREVEVFALLQQLAEVLMVQATVGGLVEVDHVLAEGGAEAAG